MPHPSTPLPRRRASAARPPGLQPLPARPVALRFQGTALDCLNLSGAAIAPPHLWLAGDEKATLERFDLPTGTPSAGRLGARHSGSFALADLIDLPGDDAETDLEGLAIDDGYLWLVGSHSLKRGKPKGKGDDEADARALASVSMDGNRLLLARVPLQRGPDGRAAPCAVADDGRRAARLRGSVSVNPLLEMLSSDPHFAPFARIPGKDNGLDIEGIAVRGPLVLLGLRGPVLRGWACLLALRVEEGARRLKLLPHAGGGAPPVEAGDARLRKHFLDLDGLGVRDLHFDGEDLVLLAGPTMELDGEVRLYRWPRALRRLRSAGGATRFVTGLRPAGTLPHGPGCDRAEAIARAPEGWSKTPAWLVVHDAPAPARRRRAGTLLADLVTLT